MVSRPAFLCCLVDTFFKGHVHNGIYNNTNFLQTECFKFDFFFRESKGTREYLGKLEQFSYLKITPILQWREAFKYLLALNLDDLDLVKKECFTDEKTRIEIAPILWTCFSCDGGKWSTWNTFFRRSLALFSGLYQLILQSWDVYFHVSYTSFSAHFLSYVNFVFYKKFYFLQWILLY